jgi:hypothetical protein
MLCIALLAGYALNHGDQQAALVHQGSHQPARNEPSVDINTAQPAVAEKAEKETGPFDDVMKHQLQSLLNDYKASARFPSYSKPLSTADWHLLNPRAFIETPMPLANLPGVMASILVPQFIHNRQRALPVQFRIQTTAANLSTADIAHMTLTLKQAERETSPIYLSGAVTEDDGFAFVGSIPPAHLSQLNEGECTILAVLSLHNGVQTQATAQIKLFDPQAELQQLGPAFVDHTDLVIPARFLVNAPGYYRIQANLFDESGTRPISHINAAFALSESNHTGLLKVHAVTLRARQEPGPYLLRDFDIIKEPDRPGTPTRFGSSLIVEQRINGFDLDAYSYEPYQNPQFEKTLPFLEAISER